MKKKGTWLLYAVLCLLLVLVGPVFAQQGPPPTPHSFYGTVTIAGSPAPVGIAVEARGTEVMTGVAGNPITTTVVGQYGSSSPFGPWLVVQGHIDEGTPIEFYVNGARAQCYDVTTGITSTTYPFHSAALTELNLMVPPPIDVDLTKTLVEPVVRPAEVGEEVQFQVVVTNTGQTAFASNPFTDTFDIACMSVISATQDGVPVPGVGPGSPSPLTWDLVVVRGGPILPAQAVQINLGFRADAVGTCLNQASVIEFDEWEQQASDSDEASVDIAELDFGDAPDLTYPTLLASNGARHIIVPGFFLGASVDAEPNGQPDATATGDDLAGLPDDEDGVVFTSSLNPGSQASVDVTASASGVLNAWLDFNANGDWADAGEQIFVDQALAAGVNHLAFPVSVGAKVGQTFARFRFDSAGGLSYVGLAPDGEVEDYRVEIIPPISVDLTKVLVEPAGGLAFVGEEVQFQVVVTNTGQTAFVSNPFTDTFDVACMSVISVTQDGVPVQGIGPGSPLTWDLVVVNGGPIVPGQVVQIDVRFRADAAGTCHNLASVTEFDEWQQQASDSDEASVEIMIISVSADFDGDGKADIAVYGTNNGQWWILKSSDNNNSWLYRDGWGGPGYVPL
ncbi:MAG: GEVED domain-containing protein [Anaerolineae bacterium]